MAQGAFVVDRKVQINHLFTHYNIPVSITKPFRAVPNGNREHSFAGCTCTKPTSQHFLRILC